MTIIFKTQNNVRQFQGLENLFTIIVILVLFWYCCFSPDQLPHFCSFLFIARLYRRCCRSLYSNTYWYFLYLKTKYQKNIFNSQLVQFYRYFVCVVTRLHMASLLKFMQCHNAVIGIWNVQRNINLNSLFILMVVFWKYSYSSQHSMDYDKTNTLQNFTNLVKCFNPLLQLVDYSSHLRNANN